MFHGGQKVVCIDACDGIVEGKTYTVVHVWTCACGTALDVGVHYDDAAYLTQCPCERSEVVGATVWFLEKRFAPLEDYRASVEAVHELTQSIEVPTIETVEAINS